MQRKLRGAFRWGLGGAAGIGFLWLVYVGLTWDMRQDESAAASTYQAVAVERGDLTVHVVATGRMEPFARVIVQSEIPGIVDVVHIDDGMGITDRDHAQFDRV